MHTLHCFQTLKIGVITPIAASAAVKLNIAKRIIINPAVLKNNPDFNPLENFVEAKLIKANIGRVPKAYTNIVTAPLIKLPVVKE